MTSRQGIEIPFVNFEDIEEVKAELAKGGVKPGVCGPRVRTVTACQMCIRDRVISCLAGYVFLKRIRKNKIDVLN